MKSTSNAISVPFFVASSVKQKKRVQVTSVSVPFFVASSVKQKKRLQVTSGHLGCLS